jgi:hypothetical protein
MHKKERGSDSEDFGTRITGLGVVVEKIWMKEVLKGGKLAFWKVLVVYFENCRGSGELRM